ncbi:MAG: type I DNA topoisomerase, partial [Candidatus Delongbacteria bacterium]|nr:type I DNA topoisomerase [Candidatus Delongbacteria bacterium]
MGKSLVVVESPAKAKTISQYLGNDYKVIASVGHIIDLPPKELGVDIEDNFKPTYAVIRGKTRIVNQLKKEAGSVDQVLLATDGDLEGEAIAWHIANTIASKNTNIARVRFWEITRKSVQEAINHPEELDMQRVNAQQARRVLDRLVGYKVSPFLWKTIAKGLSAGRVQSVALRLICEREEEIENFTAVEYWSLDALFSSQAELTLKSSLFRLDGEKITIGSEEEMAPILEDARRTTYHLESIKRKETKRKPQAPFITSTLQQDAARRLGFSARKIMTLAQQLYEGQDIGHGETVGLITYMRTDSRRVALEALSEVRDWLGQHHPDCLPEKPLTYTSSKKAQDAHEAIRPTAINRTPDELKQYLTNDLWRLYQLIWSRFVASQMTPALFDQTTIDITGGRFVFRTTGTIMRKPAFLAIYPDAKAKEVEQEPSIPEGLVEGEQVDLKELFPDQHFTKPPPRFNESSLVKELDELGIGRPSTYASIISTIEARNYVEKQDRRFTPTELGRTVNKILISFFSDFFNVDFTARMEEGLDSIVNGGDWVEIVRTFYTPLEQKLAEVMEQRDAIKEKVTEKTGEACPECGADLISRWGRNGKFIGCSTFPKCRYTRSLEAGNKAAPQEIGVDCLKDGCDGQIVERRTRRGKVFFGCSKYPKCDFAAWDRPVVTPCPACSHKYILMRENRSGTIYLCPECK